MTLFASINSYVGQEGKLAEVVRLMVAILKEATGMP